MLVESFGLGSLMSTADDCVCVCGCGCWLGPGLYGTFLVILDSIVRLVYFVFVFHSYQRKAPQKYLYSNDISVLGTAGVRLLSVF